MDQNYLEQNKNLRKELADLKAQISNLKKENIELRREKCEYIKNKGRFEDQLIKKVRLLEKEKEFNDVSFSSNEMSVSNSSKKILIFKDSNDKIKHALKELFIETDFLSEEMISRIKVFQEYFYEDFIVHDASRIIEFIETKKIEGERFVKIFMLFVGQKEIFERYWEYFFSLPLYINEKKEVVENVPIEWIIEHIEDTPTLKKFILVYEKPETINGLKKYLIRYQKILFDFYCKLIEKKPELITNLLSQEIFDCALNDKSAISARLIMGILKAGGLRYINEKNIIYLNDRQLQICFNNSSLSYKNYMFNDSKESISFDEDIEDLSS